MMKFLTLFLLTLLTAIGACAQVETMDLGPHGRLTVYLLGDWKADISTLGKQATMTIKPTNESVNASCTIAVSFPETDRFDNKSRLKLRVEADCYMLAESSVERKAVAKEFALASGFGFYCNFTDPDLRGQPPQKGNYKVTSIGKIKLSPEVIADVQILADGFRDEPYQQLLGAIEGMEFSPAGGGR